MKKFFSLIFLAAAVTQLAAQTYSNHLTLSAGYYFPRTIDATVALEHETRYHNAWEYMFNYSLQYEKDEEAGHYTPSSFWKNNNTWSLGAAYKPCVTRSRNTHGNLRLGAAFGGRKYKEEDAKFQAVLLAGFEQSFNLRHGWQLFYQIRTDMMPGNSDFIKVGATLGMKIPLEKR